MTTAWIDIRGCESSKIAEFVNAAAEAKIEAVITDSKADTAMGGLACREISPITWPVVGLAADWFMTIAEDRVMPTRRLLAHPLESDPAIASGPSGCAGMAGLVQVCEDERAFEALKLDRRSRVLVINSEGTLGEEPA